MVEEAEDFKNDKQEKLGYFRGKSKLQYYDQNNKKLKHYLSNTRYDKKVIVSPVLVSRLSNSKHDILKILFWQ